jgi:hypothetical protein
MGTRDWRVGEDQTEAGTEASGEVGEATGTKRSGAKIVGRVADKRILIDGETLANLMIDHSVGVSLQRSYEVKRVDSDYFSEAWRDLPLFFLLPLPDDRDRRPHHPHGSSPTAPPTSIIPKQLSYPVMIGRMRHKRLDLRAWELEKQPRGSPVRFYQYPTIRIATETVREALSGSEKVLELYSPPILRLVRTLVSLSTSSVSPHVLVVAGAGKYSLGTSLRNAWETAVL